MYSLILGILYLVVGVALFVLNLAIYAKYSPFKTSDEILITQNPALGRVIRGQLIGQSIMIGMVIYFLGLSYNHSISVLQILSSLGEVALFGTVGIVLIQSSLHILGQFIPLDKEIIEDKNEALGMIVEALLIGISLIISISLFSY